ncbi:hypothetical protein Oweho_3200 [Owenweeksia hongkongensis DSM 17368]|uniref:Uncharacterized protein n=1 Tax=Owenweeksia hongkongensis (strain DSM 17368 / CIP 108786 / JCM 12287 / NRRL B-23963 / UST20020801) TaxID=926562 RepID=G8R3R4_OWEHD|nr:DUF6712 family protein [Owenweeksia hongkongensis]AEV34151.1 hypothetical protein Oweho_3200 [Owenweeksia hongkongensis DSM 17368]
MVALFNKSQANNVDEVRLHCSFLDADLAYSKISGELEYESEEIRLLIGDDTYQRVLTHYLSNDYNQPAEANPTLIILNRLVYLIQAPVANFAYIVFAAQNDINHTGNGRAIHVSENEKPAFEWQIDRADASLHKKAQRQVDQLLKYLEEKRDVITEWKDSDERQAHFDLIISDADQLERIFPIDRSRWLYLKLTPFLREFQEDVVLSTLGLDRFEALQAKLKGTTALDADDRKLLSLIRKPMGLFAISLGLKRLSIKFWPVGLVQGYRGDTLNRKAGSVAQEGARYRLADELNNDVEIYLKRLEDHITALDLAENPPTTTSSEEPCPYDPTKENFFTD